jgi:uncharacterized protein DUF6178
MTSENNNIIQRLQSLKKEREKLLALPPADTLKHLIADKRAVEIVHSFPAEDLHLLIRDIGTQDALPILSLASSRQWEYILDTEIWHKDRLDLVSATKWLHMLLAADPNRLVTWCSREKTTFIELFLLHNLEVKIREHDQSPSEFDKEFMTFDDTIYFRILDAPIDLQSDADPDSLDLSEQYLKDRKEFLVKLLERLSDFDHTNFQNLLLESIALIPAETEEEAYRLRKVRLAEKGFLPFEEAVGIYQPLEKEQISRRTQRLSFDSTNPENFMPVPFYAPHLLSPGDIFAKAISSIRNENTLMKLQSEFAGLCNQLLVADQKAITGRHGLQSAVKKASGYLGIGLESLSQKHAVSVENYLLADIFRIGFGTALKLKWQAETWRRSSWFTTQELPLSFWGEKWMGVIGGLLIKRPLYFDNYQSGTLYREFSNRDDITCTQTILTNVMAFDRLLAALSLDAKPFPATGILTYKNFILTHWARATIDADNEDKVLSLLPLEDFKSFFDTLWRSRQKPRSIRLTIKSDFLKWLAQKSGLPGNEITDSCGGVLEDLFTEIEQELGQVSSKDLEPRFSHLFLLA